MHAFPPLDFNNNRGTQTVTEGTDAIVRLATLPKGRPNRHLSGSQRRRPLVTCPVPRSKKIRCSVTPVQVMNTAIATNWQVAAAHTKV
jgi:hypothetical protein